jgi:Peptidase family M23
MRRLLLTTATALLAFVLLVPPAWAAWVWPLQGEVITSYRNGTDPYASGQHRGIDIAGAAGSTVVAAAGGEVRFAGTAGSSGLTVSIRTADGRLDTSYLHLASTGVREGDRVSAGQRIGTVGTSGSRSAAVPHLHFGVRDAGTRHAYHDPLGFLPPPPAGPRTPRETPSPQPAPAPAAPAPAPVRAPAPHREPVGGPAPRRVPVGAPGARRVPVGAPNARRVPIGAPGPRLAPRGAPNARRVPIGAPGARRVPIGAPGPRHAPRGAPNAPRLPVGAPGARRVPIGAPGPDHAPDGAPNARRVPGGAPGEPPAPMGERGPQPASASSARAHRPPTGATSPAGAPAAHAGNAPNADPGGSDAPGGPDVGLVLACLGLLAAAASLGLSDRGRSASGSTRRRIARIIEPVLGRR